MVIFEGVRPNQRGARHRADPHGLENDHGNTSGCRGDRRGNHARIAEGFDRGGPPPENIVPELCGDRVRVGVKKATGAAEETGAAGSRVRPRNSP